MSTSTSGSSTPVLSWSHVGEGLTIETTLWLDGKAVLRYMAGTKHLSLADDIAMALVAHVTADALGKSRAELDAILHQVAVLVDVTVGSVDHSYYDDDGLWEITD